MKTFNRREFLSLGTGLMAGLILHTPRWAFAQTARLALPDVASLMKDVGLRYREWSGENDLDTISAVLLSEGGKNDDELRDRLIDKIHREFEFGKSGDELLTFKYQGWIVSKTEGRLCALQSFVNS